MAVASAPASLTNTTFSTTSAEPASELSAIFFLAVALCVDAASALPPPLLPPSLPPSPRQLRRDLA
eukprot:311057-Pleurochrysis_carterae.AAC.1